MKYWISTSCGLCKNLEDNLLLGQYLEDARKNVTSKHGDQVSFSITQESIGDNPFYEMLIKSDKEDILASAFRDYLDSVGNQISNVSGSDIAEKVLNERMKKVSRGGFIFGRKVVDDLGKLALLDELKQLH